MSMKTEYLMILGGVVHFLVLIASIQVPRVLQWDKHLPKIPAYLRRLFWVYGVFIVLVIAGFGLISLICAAELAAGGRLARSFCAFVSVFWITRLVVQYFVFLPAEMFRHPLHKIGYHLLTVAFISLAAAYGYTALKGGTV